MTGLLIGAATILALALTGAGMARRRRPDGHGLALNATLALAALVVLSADVGSVWGLHAWAVVLMAAAIAIGGWASSTGPLIALPRPTRAEAAGLGLLALALAVPLLILPVPLDTDAQGFGYLALMIRDGGTLNSLAPWHPEIASLYAPGALLIFATLSRLFPFAYMSAVMMGAAHASVFLFVLLAWEFGGELGAQTGRAGAGAGEPLPPDRISRWKWAAGAGAALSVGLWSALLDSHYTAVMGLPLALAAILCLFRYQRNGKMAEAACAALAAAATLVTHVDTAMALALGFGAWILLSPLAADRPSLRRWLTATLAIPWAAAAIVSPWLISLWPLLEGGARSPFPVGIEHWRVLTLYHGLVWPLAALLGVILLARGRRTWVLTMVGWLAITAELSLFGIPEQAFPWLAATLLRFDFAFSLAWHAPIIPYLALGGGALVAFAERLGVARLRRWAAPVALATAGVLAGILVLRGPLLEWSRGRLRIYGAFATQEDLAAMRWLRDHTPMEAQVLNYPGDYLAGRDWEAHWAPVIAERDCVYFRRQPFFLDSAGEPIDAGRGYAEQLALLAFWRDPADPAHQQRLQQAGIQYVLVPDSVGDPGARQRSWRWQPPVLLPEAQSQPSEAPYLETVFSSGGARVYRVLP